LVIVRGFHLVWKRRAGMNVCVFCSFAVAVRPFIQTAS